MVSTNKLGEACQIKITQLKINLESFYLDFENEGIPSSYQLEGCNCGYWSTEKMISMYAIVWLLGIVTKAKLYVKLKGEFDLEFLQN